MDTINYLGYSIFAIFIAFSGVVKNSQQYGDIIINVGLNIKLYKTFLNV